MEHPHRQFRIFCVHHAGNLDLGGADHHDIDPLARQVLEQRGWSMMPIIRDGDVITVAPQAQPLPGIGDVVAFVRPSSGHLVVHRVVAREEAAVVWSKQIRWIDRKDFLVLRAELYDEDGYLVRSEKASELKIMDGRNIPTLIELVPAENEGYKTILKIIEIKFNIKIEESFFSQQNMKTIR